MADIRIIALDLDGTLLTSDKRLSPGNAAALERAAARGIEIVPTTGRFYDAMPAVIRELPYMHYAITINGAQVYDIGRDKAVSTAEIPLAQALDIMAYLDGLPLIYDCYMDNKAWMTRAMWDQADVYAPDIYYLKMLRELRTPVDELKAFVRAQGRDIQKIQFFTNDQALRVKLLRELGARFPDTAISTSVVNNVEINAARAHKGAALRQLADYLGLAMTQTMAFGDGLNDVSMIAAAGVGVAMANGCDEAKAKAAYITADCDSDGVAQAIERFCLQA